MELSSPISSLPKTSPITIKRLESIGINSFWDLLNYFPYRYEDYSLISPINKIQPGEKVTLQGQIINIKNQYLRSGLKIQKLILADQTGRIQVIWYNQPFLLKILRPSIFLSVSGEIKEFDRSLIIEPDTYEIINSLHLPQDKLIHTGRIIPIYSEKKQLTSRLLREKIFYLLAHLDHDRGKNETILSETLPKEILGYNHLIDLPSAYKNIHFPKNRSLAQSATRRLAFDELFRIQLAVYLSRHNREKENVSNHLILDEQKQKIINIFITNLPFKLTTDQQRSIKEIFSDLTAKKPMNRFLQGDVGSGKTVVAAIACFLTYLNGFQSLFMAPTEILAHQHYQTISNLFQKLKTTKIELPKIGLQTRSHKISRSSSHITDFNIIIGTHALLNKKLKFKKIGLVVVDEQHRFGVIQRAQLKNKGLNPHFLTMTATPIPRTVALTLYGDLDISSILQMPPGRLAVKTFLVPQEKRTEGYQWIKKEIINKKLQAFIICPLIEESDKETMKSVKAAEKEYQYLKNEVFADLRLGLLHGRLKTEEKNKIMTDFKNKLYDILVATPVVEVGIDIPNANIMLIEGAERYGLAQLHQLRGRVGRGQTQAYCFLFTEKEDKKILDRLRFFAKTISGIKLAEYDLQHRGPGEIYGTKQHGFINLKIAKLTDYQLIKQSRDAVQYFINHYQISNFPSLKKFVEEYRLKQFLNN